MRALQENITLRECDLAPKIHVELSWKLIGYRLMYYRPDLVHRSWKKELRISDFEYDMYEDEYKEACRVANVRPYTSEMVGIETDKPSVKIAIERYSHPRDLSQK